MKKNLLIIIMILPLIFSACKTDNSIGLSIQPPQDAIKVVIDTFLLSSADFAYDSISAQCNDSLSMLLGEYYNTKYGSTKAELIVQIAPPLNYEFPDEARYNPQPDSVIILLSYTRWYGSETEPLEIAVYELDKATPDYSAFYPANFHIDDFINVNDNLLLGRKILTSVDQTLSDSVKNTQGMGTYHSIRYKFDENFTQKIFDIAKHKYSKAEEFLDDFKGFYITTTYGQSTMLYLLRIDMRFYYHYTYQKNGNDTIVNTYIEFPANKEVRQLNNILHINTQNIINQRDSVNYIKTGGGIYPKIKIPIGSMRKQILDSIGDKILNLNSAILSVEATEIDNAKNGMPTPSSLLMLPVSEMKTFFQSNSLAALKSNTAAIVGYNSTKKEYMFDIAYLLNKLIKSDYHNFDETAEFILIPVDVYSTNGVISEIKPQKYIGAATIRSAKNQYSPMRIELAYSGF
jgi:hypothetical protein